MASRVFRYLSSSVMKKQVMGVTGLLLCGFLVSHLAGNMLIMVGPEAFNVYGHTLVSNPLIYVAEVVLMTLFAAHVALAFKLTIENKQARPESYYMKQPTGRGATFASSTMPYTGLIILIFLVLHILQFKFGAYYSITHNGVEMRDLYKLLIEYFHNPLAIAWYIFCMIAAGIHVSHGLWSAFQSLGFNHPKYTPCLRGLSKLFGVLIALGFSTLPIYCFMQGGN